VVAAVSAAAVAVVSQAEAIPIAVVEEVSKLIYKDYLLYKPEHIIGFSYFFINFSEKETFKKYRL
jgi:hypothetical protein